MAWGHIENNPNILGPIPQKEMIVPPKQSWHFEGTQSIGHIQAGQVWNQVWLDCRPPSEIGTLILFLTEWHSKCCLKSTDFTRSNSPPFRKITLWSWDWHLRTGFTNFWTWILDENKFCAVWKNHKRDEYVFCWGLTYLFTYRRTGPLF